MELSITAKPTKRCHNVMCDSRYDTEVAQYVTAVINSTKVRRTTVYNKTRAGVTKQDLVYFSLLLCNQSLNMHVLLGTQASQNQLRVRHLAACFTIPKQEACYIVNLITTG